MASRSLRPLVAALLFAGTAFPSLASAHTQLEIPKPRDFGQAGADAHKAGPCGIDRGAGQTETAYNKGATIPIFYRETIDHTGCFKVQIAETGDTNWTTLATIDDPAGDPSGVVHKTDVQLPAGVTCTNCTLRVTQLMIGRACVGTDTPENSSTYFTCANITIVDGTAGPPPVFDPDAGAVADAGSGTGGGSDAGRGDASASGGNTTPPDDEEEESTSDAGKKSSGSKRAPLGAAPGAGGCSMGGEGDTPLAFTALGLGLVAFAFTRRARKA